MNSIQKFETSVIESSFKNSTMYTNPNNKINNPSMRSCNATKFKVLTLLMFMTLGFLTSFNSMGQATSIWYQTKDSSALNTNYNGTSGGTLASVSGSARSGTYAYSHTPASTTTKYWWNSLIGTYPAATTGYAHMIYWAKVSAYNGATSASTTIYLNRILSS